MNQGWSFIISISTPSLEGQKVDSWQPLHQLVRNILGHVGHEDITKQEEFSRAIATYRLHLSLKVAQE